MGIYNKLKQLFQPPNRERNYWFYVRCGNCDEVLKGRVDLYNDLSLRFEESSSKNVYYCRKVIIGSKGCYCPIEVEMFFDTNRRMVDKRITGGDFVTEQDYLE